MEGSIRFLMLMIIGSLSPSRLKISACVCVCVCCAFGEGILEAEFILSGTKGQSFHQENSWEGHVNGSCIFGRLCFNLNNVSLYGCCLFRCFQFKIIFLPLWWTANSFINILNLFHHLSCAVWQG